MTTGLDGHPADPQYTVLHMVSVPGCIQLFLNVTQWQQPQAVEADSMYDPAKSADRLALWSEIYTGVMEQAPWVPVFNEERYTMKSERLGGEDALYVDPVSIPVNYDYVFVK